MPPTIRILGTHGVPAAYGGFETAAENVGLYLAARGWRVVVYCQNEGRGPITTDSWSGLERVNIPVDRPAWRGTARFDFLSIRHAARYSDVCLVLGYNTAGFNLLQKIRHIPLVINMDGIEWSRQKWGPVHKGILYANERIASAIGDELIADHPAIEAYLRSKAPRRKITMIPYGAKAIHSAPTEPVVALGLEPGRYLTIICRAVPENSILELVRGFSARRRGVKLAVLGDYDTERDGYHRQIREAASDEVVFPGSIYDSDQVAALRFHSKMYLHGHQVGGTNPSLVEAMAAGNPVLAHDNVYNRWVAANGAEYFRTAADVEHHLDRLLDDRSALDRMSMESRRRHCAEFTWETIGAQYEAVISRQLRCVRSPSGSR